MRKTPPGAGWTKSPSPVLQGQSAEPTTTQRAATYKLPHLTAMILAVAIAGLCSPADAQVQRSGGGEAQKFMQQYQQIAGEKTALQAQLAQMKKDLDAAKADLAAMKKERDALKGRAAGGVPQA